MSNLKITWKRSLIGYSQRQRRVIEALGLKRLQHSVVHHDSPTIRGMISKVSHMLEIEEVKDSPRKAASRKSGAKS
ncbi:MAG: 50S ribosomal protein L30 [SAR202 cluster bacterium]|nr:50S ribosomal protein L30 [SAR202 cluster bacterium]